MLNDLWEDKSSGLLMLLIVFIAAIAIANLGVCLGADAGQLALLVGTFLGVGAGAGIGQALQGKPKEMVDESEVVGVVESSPGHLDIIRVLKLVAIAVALEIAVLILFVRKDVGLIGTAELCGVFLAYATANEITQKVSGT